jgi:hypothetical protein
MCSVNPPRADNEKMLRAMTAPFNKKLEAAIGRLTK